MSVKIKPKKRERERGWEGERWRQRERERDVKVIFLRTTRESTENFIGGKGQGFPGRFMDFETFLEGSRRCVVVVAWAEAAVRARKIYAGPRRPVSNLSTDLPDSAVHERCSGAMTDTH